MAIYKILEISPSAHDGPFRTQVNAWPEYWPTLADALNDLARAHWEVDEYIYGMQDTRDRVLVGVVLINRVMTQEQELGRTIEVVETRASRLRKGLETSRPDAAQTKSDALQLKQCEEVLRELTQQRKGS